jgi:hypothetical protein
MIMSPPWHRTLVHSAVVVLIAILAGVVHVFIENDLRLPDPILSLLPRMGLYPSVLRSIDEAFLLLFTFGGLIATIVFLFRTRFIVALAYLTLTASVFVATQVSVVLKGSRFSFPGKAHDEIVEIYRQRGLLAGLSRPGIGEGLVALGEECNPPYGCECWIARGPALEQGIEKDLDRDWHPPKSAVFRTFRPNYFAIVHVRRIDGDAYSVLGCEIDLR